MLAIVLSRRDCKEYDQIISLYTQEQGKIEAVAKGIKKITSKNASLLEPFSVISFGQVQGKEIPLITNVVSEDFFTAIRNNFCKSLLASYATNYLNKTLKISSPDHGLFVVIYSWLVFLEKTQTTSPLLLDAFLLASSKHLGYIPYLHKCLFCGRSILADDNVFFILTEGGASCLSCQGERKIDITHATVMKSELRELLLLFLQADWETIPFAKISSALGKEIHQFLLSFFEFYFERKFADWWEWVPQPA